jgi:hypothetical protein
MPSPNLRKARVLLRHYCEELRVDYLETGLIASCRQALTSLHQAGAPLRLGRCGVVDAPSTSAAVAPAFAGAARRDGDSGDTVAVLRQMRRRRGEAEELLETAQGLLGPQTGSFTSEVGALLEYVGSTLLITDRATLDPQWRGYGLASARASKAILKAKASTTPCSASPDSTTSASPTDGKPRWSTDMA